MIQQGCSTAIANILGTKSSWNELGWWGWISSLAIYEWFQI